MKIKETLLGLSIVLATTFSGSISALAHVVEPIHYHVGKVQPFQGLVCKSQESAMHIFNTWTEKNINSAKRIFLVYDGVNECKHLVGYSAYFVEKLTSSIAAGFDGKLDNIIVFSISPSKDSETVDFLVTWENYKETI